MMKDGYGLVLEGGGGKGSYEIGVYKALLELEIPIIAITGTSVGALNGAIIAQGGFQDAHDLWYNMDPGLVVNTDTNIYQELINFNIDIKGMKKYFHYVKDLITQGGLDIAPLKDLIQKYTDEDKIRESEIEYGLVTVSLTDLKPLEVFIEDIPKGELTNYLLASAYLPGFKSEQLGGKRFLDGGFYDNAPIKLMTQKGIMKIIVVRLNVLAITRMPKSKELEILEISPSGDNGSILDFTLETARENLLMGYYDTLRIFGRTEGFRYCITEVPDEKSYLKRLMSVEPELIEAIADEMSLAKGYPTRVLFEGIIPELVRLYGCDEADQYRDIFLTVLEYYADICEINRYKIYTYNEFLEQLKSVDKSVFEKNFNIDRIPKVLRRAALVSSDMKKSLLIKIMLLFFA